MNDIPSFLSRGCSIHRPIGRAGAPEAWAHVGENTKPDRQ
jgi:hypothetical protein